MEKRRLRIGVVLLLLTGCSADTIEGNSAGHRTTGGYSGLLDGGSSGASLGGSGGRGEGTSGASGTGGGNAMGGADASTSGIGGSPIDSGRGGTSTGGTGGAGKPDSSAHGSGGASADAAPDAANSTVCGNGICERLERTIDCPADCTRTLTNVGVEPLYAIMWQLGTSTFMNWDGAKTYCADLDLDGYTNWRMPTMQEHQAIVGNCVRDYFTGDTTCSTCAESALCTAWFPTEELDTWNSFEYGTCCAGGVNFKTGAADYTLYKTNFIRVRCVRDVPLCTDSSTCLGTESCVLGACVPLTDLVNG